MPASHMMRATPKRFIKSLFICSVMGFLVINLNLFLKAEVEDHGSDLSLLQDTQGAGAEPGGGGAAQGGGLVGVNFAPVEPVQGRVGVGEIPPTRNANETIKQWIDIDRQRVNGLNNMEDGYHEPVVGGNASVSGYSIQDLLEYRPIGTDPTVVKEYIAAVNKAQPIRNLDKFDLSTSQETIVIVVQIHNRDEYLTYLIESLKKAQYINQALLIFSHDYFDDKLNKMIAEIDFCPTMQIFYPRSIQLHPHEYPGEDPADCRRDMTRDQAMKAGCVNANWPDKYGHYREAKYTQTKHHWFWKLNHVFDYLEVTKNFNGPVLLLEEDHYVAEDFIHILWKMYRFKDQACKECSIFTIGSYEKHPMYGSMTNRGLWARLFGGNEENEPKVDRVEIMNWISSKHNMGMALNREVWHKIKACTKEFCEFDDYNWDWSLQHISMTCIPNKLRVMVMKSPRIFHIGECGVHHKGKNGCHPTQKVAQIDTLLTNSKASLFPDALAVHGFPKSTNRKLKPNGGWGDQRDHNMCKDFLEPNYHR